MGNILSRNLFQHISKEVSRKLAFYITSALCITLVGKLTLRKKVETKSCCTLNNFVCIDTVVSSFAIIVNTLANVICFFRCAKRIWRK